MPAAQTQTPTTDDQTNPEPVQNFHHQYYTAFTPTPNIGAPRLWRMGLRWDSRVH